MVPEKLVWKWQQESPPRVCGPVFLEAEFSLPWLPDATSEKLQGEARNGGTSGRSAPGGTEDPGHQRSSGIAKLK